MSQFNTSTPGEGASGAAATSSTQTSTPSTQTSAVKDELKQDAEKLTQSAKAQAEDRAETARDQAVSTARSASSAIETAASELRQDDDAPDWLASMLTSASSQIEQLAEEVEGKSPRDMMNVAQQFGRRNPATFLAASAATGFAAGRLLRAGAEQHDDVGMVEPNDHTGSRPDYGYRTAQKESL